MSALKPRKSASLCQPPPEDCPRRGRPREQLLAEPLRIHAQMRRCHRVQVRVPKEFVYQVEAGHVRLRHRRDICDCRLPRQCRGKCSSPRGPARAAAAFHAANTSWLCKGDLLASKRGDDGVASSSVEGCCFRMRPAVEGCAAFELQVAFAASANLVRHAS